MCTILQEAEVTTSRLAEHMEDSGWDVDLEKDKLLLHTMKGLGFWIGIDTARQFIWISTYLPIRKDFTGALAWVNTLNEDVFLVSFSIDRNNNLIVGYQMSYERGLILGQFARIIRRFALMLEHVVNDLGQNDQVFTFGSDDPASSEGPRTLQ